MPETNPQETLDTSASDVCLNRFESAWRAGGTPPDWRQYLPADEEQRGPDYISGVLKIDIEYRIKAGLPALLAEHYFDHPRLQKGDARLTDEQQVELIRWEYQLRWETGERWHRTEYEASFPQYAEALRQMKPQWRCPRCHKEFVLGETCQTLSCPDCGESSVDDADPSGVTESAPTQFDLRKYELIEVVNQGGMGEVYRSGDPALGRDLAIKVMKSEHRGQAKAERRFLREARVTGSLQHPGIVPVYNLGRLSDARLHYTMRLVRGQTFAEILKGEGGKPERLPSLLSIFEKICQAMAYAHSKRVIHRDLKPQNVMVGKFGEVQVIDWGLAKVLTPGDDGDEPEETTDIAGTRIFTESTDTPVDLSRTGAGFGTLQYMPSEQARGKWSLVDERADVFALGSILCEILTGQPAYLGSNSTELWDRVERGDVSEALQRLQKGGADATLTALCRECLSPHRDQRPRDAAAVAKGVAEYQAEVQERLQRAELERVAAEVKAKAETERAREALGRVKAERRARRRAWALTAAMVTLLLAGGRGRLWWRNITQNQADREALAILERTGPRLEEGWEQQDLATLTEVKAEAERAADIARRGDASSTVRQQVAEFQTKVQKRFARAEKNRDLLIALLDVAIPHETKTYRAADSRGMMKVLADSNDAIALASMYQQPYKKPDAVSARLYTDSFTTDLKLAANPNQQHRYNAACAAALAAGQEENAHQLPDKSVAMFRRWALDWLRDDLTTYSKLAAQNDDKANKAIQQYLAQWRCDADLATVRDPSALKRLPDSGRAAWQALWRDVDELAKRVTKTGDAKNAQ